MTIVDEQGVERYGPTPVIDTEAQLDKAVAEVERLFDACVGSATVHMDCLDALRRARLLLYESERRTGERRHVPKFAERAAQDDGGYPFRQLLARWREHTALDW